MFGIICSLDPPPPPLHLIYMSLRRRPSGGQTFFSNLNVLKFMGIQISPADWVSRLDRRPGSWQSLVQRLAVIRIYTPITPVSHPGMCTPSPVTRVPMRTIVPTDTPIFARPPSQVSVQVEWTNVSAVVYRHVSCANTGRESHHVLYSTCIITVKRCITVCREMCAFRHASVSTLTKAMRRECLYSPGCPCIMCKGSVVYSRCT